MTTQNLTQSLTGPEPGKPEQAVAEFEAIVADGEPDTDWPEEAEELLDYEDQPLLLVDTDTERAVERQREMMEACFGGIGSESKQEKRAGLAMQQLDIEQRHALRLLLMFQDPAALAAHLRRCLDDPAFGYGERGDNGRTIARAMASLAPDGDLEPLAAAWLASHQNFQRSILSGVPLNFRSLFDYGDLDSFIPLLQRTGDMTWRLGIEGEGKFRDFHGPIEAVWPRIGETYVNWCDEDNEAWLTALKRRAARLPESILRAARADRLRKEKDRIEADGTKIRLVTGKDSDSGTASPGGGLGSPTGKFGSPADKFGSPAGWPRMVTMADEEGTALLGLSRLSGHAFYELAWNGGLNVRRFELSGTSRNKVPFEHIELALLLAETLGQEAGLLPEPVTATEVETAYLRRMKAAEAEIGPPQFQEVPAAISGQPAAAYRVNDILVTMLYGGQDIAYVTVDKSEAAFVLRPDPRAGAITILPVVRGRPRRTVLMSTLLAELDLKNGTWNRAVCAWAAWLASVLK